MMADDGWVNEKGLGCSTKDLTRIVTRARWLGVKKLSACLFELACCASFRSVQECSFGH